MKMVRANSERWRFCLVLDCVCGKHEYLLRVALHRMRPELLGQKLPFDMVGE